MKLYTVAGTSILNGRQAYRFANSMSRAGVLARNGHEHVHLVELPEPMTKESAIEFLRKGAALSTRVATAPKSGKPRKETVLWRSMSARMRSFPHMQIYQYQDEQPAG